MNDSIQILLEVVDKASPQLQQFQQNLQTTAQSVKSFASSLAIVSGALATAAVGGLALMAKNAINMADDMNDAAERIGITTESLSVLGHAATMSGTTMEAMQTGLQQLNKSIVESADPTTAAANAFKYLGVEVKNADGTYKKADEVFKAVAESFTKMPEGPSKTAVAMELLGKQGASLIPVLNGGAAGLDEFRAEAERLGIVISTETAKQAGQFNDTVDRLTKSITGVALSIASEVLPTLNALAAEMVKNVKEGEGFKSFAKGVGEVFKWVVKAGAGVVLVFNTIGKGIGALAAAASRIIAGDFAGAKQIISDYGDETKAAALSTAEFMEKIDAGIPPLEKSADATTNAGNALGEYTNKSKAAKDAKDAETKAFEKAYAAMLKESEGYKELTTSQQVEYNIAQKVAGFRTAEHQEQMRRLGAQIDANRRLKSEQQGYIDQSMSMTTTIRDLETQMYALLATENDYYKLSDRQTALQGKAREAWNGLYAEIHKLNDELDILGKNPVENAKKIEDLKARVDGIKASIKDGADAFRDKWTEGAMSIDAANLRMDTFKKYIGDARDRMQKLADEAGALKDALDAGKITQEQYNLALERLNTAKFAEMRSQVTELQKKTADFAGQIQNTFGDVFYNIMQGNFKDIGTMFKQMLDKMVAEALAAKLAQALFGDFQRTGSVSGQGGGMLTSLVGSLFSFREDGGPVTAGQPYIVGEKRAELFVPRTSGTILPDTSALAMAGGNSVQLSITAMDSQDVIRALDKIKRPLADMVNSTGRAYNMK